MMESIKELLQKEAAAVLNIPVGNEYEKAINMIVEQVHNKGGKLVTTGMGKAGQIAMNIATTFCSTGIPSVFLHPSEAQHGDLGIFQENDLLLLISNSGKTREIIELTQLSRVLNPNLKFIVITGNQDSPLAKESDVCLCTGNPKEVCALGMTPDNIHHGHDRHRRYFSGGNNEKNRFYHYGLLQTSSWRLSWREIENTL